MHVSSGCQGSKGKENVMVYWINEEKGHYEVYINGEFYCSADTHKEALREIDEYERESYCAEAQERK